MDSVNGCVWKYLSDAGCGDGDRGWTIAASTVAGRGVVATVDYGEGDVIFVDAPLIVSPRVVSSAAAAAAAALCAVCYASAAPAGCAAGCGLPVCGERCSDRPEHSAECLYVRRLRPRTDRSWSVGVYNAIAPVRGLQAFRDGPHAFFLDVLQKRRSDKSAFEEFGTELAALNCVVECCDGRILPLNPLDSTSIWQCKVCTKLVSDVEVSSSYKDIESLVNSADVLCPDSLETILKTFNVHKDSPFVVGFRLKFIWTSKNNSLNLEHLLYKERSCVEMLNIVQKLGLGQCRLLGLISLELVKVVREKINRFRWNTKTLNIFKEQTTRLNQVVLNILGKDVDVKCIE